MVIMYPDEDKRPPQITYTDQIFFNGINHKQNILFKNSTAPIIACRKNIEIENSAVMKCLKAKWSVNISKTSVGLNVFIKTINNYISCEQEKGVNCNIDLVDRYKSLINEAEKIRSCRESESKKIIGGDVSAKTIGSCKESEIEGTLSCSNEMLTITVSKIHTIVIKALNISNKSKSCGQLPSIPTLILEDSEVKKVVFEGGNGRVILKGSSKAPEITGGEIEPAC